MFLDAYITVFFVFCSGLINADFKCSVLLLSSGRLWSLYDPEERGGTFLPFCFVAISIEPFRLNFETAVLICGTPIVRPGSKYFQGWLLVPRVFEIVVRM